MNAKRPAPPGQRSRVAPPGQRSRVAPPPDQSPQNIKDVVFDPITMLLWKLLAVFHDVIHDFGLSIERMSSIVLYINHMAEELRERAPQANAEGGRSRKTMRGGLYKKRIISSIRKPSPLLQKRMSRQVLQPNTGRENNNDRNLLFDENVNVYVRFDNLYITQNNNIAIMAVYDNDIALELFVNINKLLDQLKLFVILQAISRLEGENTEITGAMIVHSIQDLIHQVDQMEQANAAEQEGYSEHSPETFQNTKIFITFILNNMIRVFTTLSSRRRHAPDGDGAVENGDGVNDNIIDDYLDRERPYFYLNLFNSQMVHETTRMIIIRKVMDQTAVVTDDDIDAIFRAFHNPLIGGRLRGSKKHSNIMYGGTKLSLAAFRTKTGDSRGELIQLLNDWNDIFNSDISKPEKATQSINFYHDRLVMPQVVDAAGRINDQRLIRKLCEMRFSQLKKDIQLLNRQRTNPSNERFTRSASVDHDAIIIQKMNVFMEQTKSDFDSLITEEQIADQQQQAAQAAAPLPLAQRNVVYQISKIIAKKGLEYARNALTEIQNDVYAMLPNLQVFVGIAREYLNNILDPNGLFNNLPVINIPNLLPIERDKYNNLINELYLLGLIYRHTGDRGLPDIDSRLFNYFKINYLENRVRDPNGYPSIQFFNNENSQQLYNRVQANHVGYRVINNSVSSGVKPLIDRAAVCTTSSRIDAMGSFGSCSSTRRDNEEYYSMGVNIRSSDNRSYYSAITRVTTEQRKSKATVVNMFNIGAIVMNSLNENIDLQTNPTILSANNVFKRSINEIMRIWKSNPATDPTLLWNALETNENFMSMMNQISQKGIGDIYQEFGGVVADAGYINPPNSIQLILNSKTTLFLAGDRPSAIRAMLFPMYSLIPTDLLRGGSFVVGYGNDTNSFLLVSNRDGRIVIPQQLGGGSHNRIQPITNKRHRKMIPYKHNKTKKR